MIHNNLLTNGSSAHRRSQEWTHICDAKVTIDAELGIIEIDLSKEELESRKKKWVKPKSDYNTGTLWKYAKQVGPARYGAVTHPGAKEETHCYADI